MPQLSATSGGRRALLALIACGFAVSCGGGAGADWEPGARQILELAVLEVPVDKIVYARAEQRFFSLTLGTATHVAESRALVKIGIRAEDLRPEHSRPGPGGSITLRLPPVEVLEFDYQPESFVVRDDLSRRSFFRRISLAERELVYRDAEADLRENVPYGPLFERAELRLRVLLESYLGRYFDRVIVEFEERG